jgi:hypothetical protein
VNFNSSITKIQTVSADFFDQQFALALHQTV